MLHLWGHIPISDPAYDYLGGIDDSPSILDKSHFVLPNQAGCVTFLTCDCVVPRRFTGVFPGVMRPFSSFMAW